MATILGYSKPANAINQHVDVEDKGVTKMMTPGGKSDILLLITSIKET